MNRDIRNICLAGFMGTGKSTIGRMVAEALRFELVDTDAWIENETGLAVERIFDTQGEPAFRAWEKRAVAELANRRGCVISTGGGLIVDPDNRDSLRRHALIVCLWASPETIYERVKDQSHRPLLRVPNPLQNIRELLAKRTNAYRQGDVLLGTDNRQPREIAHLVVQNFRGCAGAGP